MVFELGMNEEGALSDEDTVVNYNENLSVAPESAGVDAPLLSDDGIEAVTQTMTLKCLTEGIVVAEESSEEYTNSHKEQAPNVFTLIGSIPKALNGTVFVAALGLGCFVLLTSIFTPPFPIFIHQQFNYPQVKSERQILASVLQKASIKEGRNKTVILTNLNHAWAERNTIFDLFMESFQIGNDTAWLVKHLVVICMDEKAYARCSASHPYCYYLRTSGADFTNEAFFMSPSYLKMVGRKIEFLSEVLQMGYNFVFTDNDIMWLRNPFKRLSKDSDFQLSCDKFNGNSRDLRNFPNTGFMHVTSNPRTIQFYKFWNSSIKTFPGLHDQDVLNRIKFDPLVNKIGLKIRFLDTAFFGGFCQPSRDIHVVCTMHANCCVGIENKVNDLRLLLNDWKRYNSSQPTFDHHRYPWSVPRVCRYSTDL